MQWTLLLIAGLLEVGWAIGLKYSDGFSRPWPSAFTIAAMIGSLWLLALAMRTLPVGSAYGIWVGIGAVGSALLGAALLNEPLSAGRLLSIGLIVAGVAGLKMTTPG